MPIVKPKHHSENADDRALQAIFFRPIDDPTRPAFSQAFNNPELSWGDYFDSFLRAPISTLVDPSVAHNSNPQMFEGIQNRNDQLHRYFKGFNQLAGSHFRTTGVASALVSDKAMHELRAQGISTDFDPDFNVYDLVDEEFIERSPFLIDDLKAGTLPDFANEQVFWHWYNRKERDFSDRQLQSEFNTLENLIAGGVAISPDLMVGGGLFQAFKLTNSGQSALRFMQQGHLLSRSAKAATLAGLTNLAQEEMLRQINPDRNVDEVEAHLWAFGMGAAFGGGVPLLLGGGNKTSQLIATAKVRKIQKGIVDEFARPEVKNVLEHAEEAKVNLQKILDGDEAPDSFSAVITDETRPLIDAIREKFPKTTFLDHPSQADVDWALMVQQQESNIQKAMAAGGTNQAAGFLAKMMAFPTPGARVRGSHSSLTRQVGRTLFDDTTATLDSVSNPVSNKVTPSAEMVKVNYDGWRDRMLFNVDEHLRKGLASKARLEHTFGDGTTIRLTRFNRHQFGRAVVDYIRRSDQARRQGLPKPKASPAVRSAADEVLTYTKQMGDEALSVRLLKKEVDGDQFWLPQRWKTWEIRRQSDTFKQRLLAQFQRNREVDFKTGARLDETNRQVLDEVVDFSRKGQDAGRGLTLEDRVEIRKLIKDEVDNRIDFTEAQLREALGDDLMVRYNQEVGLYLDGAVESAYANLTDLKAHHGVVQATAENSFRSRMLDVEQLDFQEFLIDDLDNLINGYHHQTAGKIAARYAISKDTQLLADLKKFGFDLHKHDFDPAQLIAAIKEDFDQLIKITEKQNNSKLLDKLEANRERSIKVIENKLNELQGIPNFQHDPAAWAGWRWAGRQILRLSSQAMLGKVTIGSITDAANLVFLKRTGRKQIGQMKHFITSFEKLPPRALQGIAAANTDMMRSARANAWAELDTLSDSRNFGSGRFGRFLDKTDRLNQKNTDIFFRATGMNRWNSGMKRWASTLIQDIVIQGAQKMARAHKLVQEGMSEADAIAKVGLDPADAARLNRLGFNGERSVRLVETMRKHAVDWDGKPIKDFDKHDGWVSPEYELWWKQDRDLFDTMTTAINREVTDIIVEPKMLSRPLMNEHWAGRMVNQFQTFALSWGNQSAQLMAQRPGIDQVQAMMLAVGLGGVSDSIYNYLSGRRTFSESAQQWSENPAGMMYGAIGRSPLLGWLSRPLGIYEQFPWGIGKMLGNEHLSGTYFRPMKLTGILGGPSGSWADKTFGALIRAGVEGEMSPTTQRQLWQAAPYHNLWFIEAMLRAAEDAGIETPAYTRPRHRQIAN